MFQLRSFVNERLYAAATEIFGEVQKTISVYEFEVARSRDEVVHLRKELDVLRGRSAAEPIQPNSTFIRDGCNPALQQDPRPSPPADMEEESNLSLRHDAPGPSQTSADIENNDLNYSMLLTDIQISYIKGEQEELGIDSQKEEAIIPEQDLRREAPGPYQTSALQTDLKISRIKSEQEGLGIDSQKQDAINSFTYIVKSEPDQTDFTHQLQPLPSDCSENSNWVKSKETQTRSKKCNATVVQMNHTQMHENTVNCSVCGKTCQSTVELISHLQCAHSKSHFCDVCGKTFSKLHVLRMHSKIHTGLKQYTCQECGKAFLQKGHLIVHVRTHSGEKPYYCDICGKAFSQSQNLTIHKRSHTGEKPYQCGPCGKLFKTSSHLKIHMRNHSGEKPYSCDFCGKRFSQSGQLTTHKRTHTGQRPYECHVCGMQYRFAPNLKAHVKTHLLTETP